MDVRLLGPLEVLGDDGRMAALPGAKLRSPTTVLARRNSTELYVLLTVERGWSPDRYERWLADTWCRLLVPTE